MIIWHNSKCSKSRECIKLLDEMNIEIEIREYLKDSPSKEELKDIISMLKISDIRDMMRTKESIYKELDLKNKSQEELLDAMVRYPKLIERPLGINKGKARIGRPIENILDIL